MSILVSIKIRLAFDILEKQEREENQWVILPFPIKAECTDDFLLAS